MDKKELKVHQQFHKAISKEKKKENELLKAKEDKRQKAWKGNSYKFTRIQKYCYIWRNFKKKNSKKIN